MSKIEYLKKPKWLYRPIPGGKSYSTIQNIVKENKLYTVCESASCPNLGECWDRGTATFMILGNICTRGCRFCDVPKGNPTEYDENESERIALSVFKMKLKYAVITSVNRDDLIDQGAHIWSETLKQTKGLNPDCYLEILIPDMQGKTQLLDLILDAKPDIFNHNFETVKRLQQNIRGRANLKDSTTILKHAKNRGFITKTSLMLGLGETQEEVLEMIHYCQNIGIDIITFGQYLMPSKKHFPVKEYISPEKFDFYKEFALSNGVPYCESSPIQRSSYKAEKVIKFIEQKKRA